MGRPLPLPLPLGFEYEVGALVTGGVKDVEEIGDDVEGGERGRGIGPYEMESMLAVGNAGGKFQQVSVNTDMVLELAKPMDGEHRCCRAVNDRAASTWLERVLVVKPDERQNCAQKVMREGWQYANMERLGDDWKRVGNEEIGHHGCLSVWPLYMYTLEERRDETSNSHQPPWQRSATPARMRSRLMTLPASMWQVRSSRVCSRECPIYLAPEYIKSISHRLGSLVCCLPDSRLTPPHIACRAVCWYKSVGVLRTPQSAIWVQERQGVVLLAWWGGC